MLPVFTYLALKFEQNGKQINFTAPEEVPTGGLTRGESIIRSSITALLIVIIILSVFFLVFGGIKWITSEGDKTKMESARKTIIYAIVGLILAGLSFVIIRIVGQVFGVTFF